MFKTARVLGEPLLPSPCRFCVRRTRSGVMADYATNGKLGAAFDKLRQRPRQRVLLRQI